METGSENNYQLDPRDAVKIVFMSLFAGRGFSSWGYRKAGLHEVLAVEWDKHARETFELNFPGVPVMQVDILTLSAEEILKFLGFKKGQMDVLDASPPCIDFSNANTAPKLDSQNIKAYFHTLDLIDGIAPKVCVIENVEGMCQGKKIPIYNAIVRKMKTMNYYWLRKVIHTEEYGVPQSRRRLIFIGLRMDIAAAFNIKDLFPKPDLENVPNMCLNKVLPHLLAVSPGQFLDGIICGDRPACTMTKTVSMWAYDKDGIRRRPTIDEGRTISSVPSEYILPGSFNQQWGGLGNGVPPEVTYAIGKHIKDHILTPEVLKWCEENPYNDDTSRIGL